MDERTVQFRVGVVVVSTAIIAMILIVMFDDGSLFPWFKSSYEVHATFRKAPGVSVKSPVRRNGVRVGEVSGIEFLDDGRVQLDLSIESRYRLRTSEQCEIRSGLLGDSIVEFVPGDTEMPSQTFLEDGAEIKGKAIPNPIEMLMDLQDDLAGAARSIAGAGKSFSSAGDSVNRLATRVDDIVAENEEEIRKLVDNAASAFDGIAAVSDKLNAVLGDEQDMEALRRGIADLPVVLENAREALASLNRNFTNLEGLTEPLGEKGDDLANQLEGAISKLDSLLGQVDTFSKALNNPDSTVGKLLNDTDLYQSIFQTAINIQCLTEKLKPILADVRVFTDKVAREPSRIINIRGALRQPSSIK
jgi:phospholipid/cholesterol/gamma-HCH transport system substrate-binding protein